MRSSGGFGHSATAVDVIVIGAGHAGLAMSHVLSEAGVEHTVLERGQVANTWRRERWPSLTLLSPNWQTRLPGREYSGTDPDGFMTGLELVHLLEDYASDLPVQTDTTVLSLRYRDGLFQVVTDRGHWRARAVVLATGACNQPAVPAAAAQLPASLHQMTPLDYQRPELLPEGGVLVVGASATGLQLAEEIVSCRNPLYLAVGEHVRMPRHYRGEDIFYWLQRTGIHDQGVNDVDDVGRARRLPSPQLVGNAALPMLDLNHLMRSGVNVVGRFAGVRGGELQFSGSLRNVCALADLKLQRLLKQIDLYADKDGAPAAQTFEPTRVPTTPTLTLHPEHAGIRTVLWATGFRPDYSWLDLPVLDRKGQLQHEGGVLEMPGLYALGLPLMRRRKSSFIHGIEDDARDIARHLRRYLDSDTGRETHELYQNATRG